MNWAESGQLVCQVADWQVWKCSYKGHFGRSSCGRIWKVVESTRWIETVFQIIEAVEMKSCEHDPAVNSQVCIVARGLCNVCGLSV